MSTKNKLSDLNNHLFEQIERLNDDKLKGEDLKEEVNRAKAMAQIGTIIVHSAKISVDAMRIMQKEGVRSDELPNLLKENN